MNNKWVSLVGGNVLIPWDNAIKIFSLKFAGGYYESKIKTKDGEVLDFLDLDTIFSGENVYSSFFYNENGEYDKRKIINCFHTNAIYYLSGPLIDDDGDEIVVVPIHYLQMIIMKDMMEPSESYNG